ncbi:MAG: bifunctional (p)ppGpp synthetase/guanosine-3',5'-bis(diphosphate) 3'-pyrophosphohydrolase [Azospirillum brasilense]|nr:MAG: bifunctional (p)ppGpp synthetase/guanosine-3',5'-bis(diphosphate) 3'-pyrophosphohydrolase [Azospirillum brasilense]
MIRQMELVEKIRAYDPDADEDALNRAYVYAMQKHGAQKRASGDPYFSHPVEVAYKLTQYRLDTASIITALLHDTVEDTDATLDEIESLFGHEIRTLVDGVTKLNRLEIKSESSKQAENFRKLVIAMAQDLRVLMVKLADRLHNMETLHYIPKPEKRQRIARETLEIYAALAERIGMRRMKEELQDLAFKELFPEARESIITRLEFLRKQGQSQIQRVEEILYELSNGGGLTDIKIYGREKKPYSIWKKMEAKGVTFEQLADIVGFRVITHSVGECYAILGLIHEKYHTIPGHFKDYISTPKVNGYQSIHTAVIGPQQQRIEVQIRTEEMHEIAEYGIAAHWGYKQNKNADGTVARDGKQYRWVRELLEILEQSEGAEEFLEHTKLEMYHDQVFAFTPKGDIIALPRGSTPVDFAFAVHSGVGFTCVGAKVNGRIVPLKHVLKNGDQVEIITAKTQTPSPTWERFVVTGKARSEIRRYMREQQRDEYITLGKAILTKTFKQEGHDLTDKMLEPALAVFKKKEADDLYAEVGEGLINRNQVYDAVFHTRKSESAGVKNPFTAANLKKKQKKAVPMPIRGLIPGMAIHFAGCCHPIPGDKIVGIVATGKGVTIHTMDCDTLENYADAPEKWLDVAWDAQNQDDLFIGRLKVSLSHETAALASVANVIAKDGGNISNLKILNRSTDFFDLLIDVEVKNSRHLQNIISSLRAKDVVQAVDRV